MDEWILAKAINKIDALSASDYLNELIEQEKMGKITTEEMVIKIKEYYGVKDE